jgi:hypothetical protein
MSRHLATFLKLLSILLCVGFLDIFFEHWSIYTLALLGVLFVVLKTYGNDI